MHLIQCWLLRTRLGISICAPPPHTHTCFTRLHYVANLDSIRNFLCHTPWNEIFSLSIGNCTSEMSSLLKAGIDAFVPSWNDHVKPFFSLVRTCLFSHHNPHRSLFRLYQRDISDHNRHFFVSIRNKCKRLFKETKSLFVDSKKVCRLSQVWLS